MLAAALVAASLALLSACTVSVSFGDDAQAVSTDVDNASGMKEIKPGATIKVQEAYVLADESEVTVEVKELFSLSDDLIATQTFPAK